MTDVPVVEVANVVRFVLDQHISLPSNALAREVARLLGVNRLGHKVRPRIDLAITRVVDRGQATEDGEKVTGLG